MAASNARMLFPFEAVVTALSVSHSDEELTLTMSVSGLGSAGYE